MNFKSNCSGILLLIGAGLLTACGNSKQSTTTDLQAKDSVSVASAEEVSEPAAPEQTAADKEASATAFLTDMYATVLPAVEQGNAEQYIPKYFGKNLLDLYRTVVKYDQTQNEGELGFFDYELWTLSQDPDANLKATVESVYIKTDDKGNDVAKSKVKLKGKFNPPTSINITMAYDGTDWKITDYNGLASEMKAYMASQNQ